MGSIPIVYIDWERLVLIMGSSAKNIEQPSSEPGWWQNRQKSIGLSLRMGQCFACHIKRHPVREVVGQQSFSEEVQI